jgi:arylsulfatase A-like enzyme
MIIMKSTESSMGMRSCRLVTTFALTLAAILSPFSVQAADTPHIVYILADDLGWEDVGFHGGQAATPHLDALALAGVRLERFYTQPNSTPTQAAIMTGRYPMRYGLQMLSILPWNTYGLPLDERLLPQALKMTGYRTAAFGQWRLGHASRDLLPTHRAFDYFYGSHNAVQDHFAKTDQTGARDWHRGEKRIKERGFATTLIAKDAAAFIGRHDPARPLFMFVSLPAPATPLQAPRRHLSSYKSIEDPELRTYYAMVSALDDAVGTIVSALENKGMTDNTLLVFHSDNGGAVKNKYPGGDGDVSRRVSSNGPFRNGRGSLYEGAVRVVAVAVWPGRIEPGVVSERVHVTDMYPTLLNLAGAPMDSEHQIKPIDGIDAWGVIAKGTLSEREETLINVDEFRGALMVGNWKLVVYSTLPSRVELYNVADDPSEEDNLASREPERVQQLLARLNDYAWEMAPSRYLDDLAGARAFETPIFWGDNPQRP